MTIDLVVTYITLTGRHFEIIDTNHGQSFQRKILLFVYILFFNFRNVLQTNDTMLVALWLALEYQIAYRF